MLRGTSVHRAISTLVVIALSGALASCATPQRQQTATIEYRTGENVWYSSVESVVHRPTCNSDPNPDVALKLSDSTLNRIGELAVQTGYFHLPHYLPTPSEKRVIANRAAHKNSIEGLEVVAPCSNTTLTISYAGNSNTVEWGCAIENDQWWTPTEVLKVDSTIRSVIDAQPAWRNRKQSNCHLH